MKKNLAKLITTKIRHWRESPIMPREINLDQFSESVSGKFGISFSMGFFDRLFFKASWCQFIRPRSLIPKR